MGKRLQHQVLLNVAALAVFFTNLGGSRLWDDDETKNATCAREMYQRGEWIVPTFNTELRTDKPALAYWLMMGAYGLFGVTEFAARLPSALLSVGTVLTTYHLGRLLFRPQAGFWAGAIMATSLMFAWVGRAATPDSALIFCTTLALLIYVWSVGRGCEGSFLGNWKSIRSGDFAAAMPQSWLAAAAIYAVLGVAVLAKGPIGLLLPAAAVGLFVLMAGMQPSPRLSRPENLTLGSLSIYYPRVALARIVEAGRMLPAALWAMRPFLLVTAVSAVALPWYLLVALKTEGAWPRGFFLTHNFERFVHPIGGHYGSILFHPLVLIGGFFPWAFLLPVGISRSLRSVRTGDMRAAAYRLLGSWVLVWFAFFTICETKLPNYVLPAYPALAIICGVWVADRIAMPGHRSFHFWLTARWASLALVGVLLTIGLGFVLPRWLPEAVSFAWIGLIPIVGAAVCWGLQRQGRVVESFGLLVVTAVMLIVAVFTVAAPPISRRQAGTQLADMLRRREAQPGSISMYHAGDAGLIYYADIPNCDFNDDQAGVKAFFARPERPILVTDAEGYEMIRSLLPADARIVDRQPRLLRRGEVLLIGREPRAEVAARINSRATDPSEAERLAGRNCDDQPAVRR